MGHSNYTERNWISVHLTLKFTLSSKNFRNKCSLASYCREIWKLEKHGKHKCLLVKDQLVANTVVWVSNESKPGHVCQRLQCYRSVQHFFETIFLPSFDFTVAKKKTACQGSSRFIATTFRNWSGLNCLKWYNVPGANQKKNTFQYVLHHLH